jgi:hypothetical protein
LDENSVIERLAGLEEITRGNLVWSDTAGVRQVLKVKPITKPLSLLDAAYRGERLRRRAA